MAYEFKFPDVGEGIAEGELLAWKVKEGDVVAADQTVAEVETDKAVVELPSPRAGRISKLHAAEGDMVKVGSVLVTIEEPAAPPAPGPAATTAVAPATAPQAAAVPMPPVAAPAQPVPADEEPYTGSVVGRLEEAPEEEEAPLATAAPGAATAPPAAPAAAPDTATAILAMPSVRALARELGVDLGGVRGTGPGGRILKQDVEDAAEAAAYGIVAPGRPGEPAAPAAAPVSGGVPTAAVEAAPAPGVPAESPAAAVRAAAPKEAAATGPLLGGVLEQDPFGPVERVPFRGIRRTMARHMAESVAKQAQVTTMDEADVTVIKKIREKERTVAAERGVRLTYLAFAIKACTAALKRFPRLNAVLQESGDEFVLKRYYNIGIAIDTKSGLVVPNIKNADEKSIFAIAAEIVDLVDRADERRLELHELHGGTFTITNYGAVGGVFATPVINYPEVAILGMGRVRELAVVRDGQVVTRLMLPLSLTFDHQLIDGAEAARFLNLVIGYLEDPDLLLLEGA
jgi:pyruvate dehydrogenase E2 component (dihydrolipoamide acetyltransferase)